MTRTIGPVELAPLTQTEAETVAGWRYEPPYDFYDVDRDEHDLAELLRPELRGDGYYGAHLPTGELIGFVQLRQEGDVVVVGLGLRPDLTGRGLGVPFLEQALDFARARLAPRTFRLGVAAFNERAITVYERVGFTRTRTFSHETNGARHAYVEMERPA